MKHYQIFYKIEANTNSESIKKESGELSEMISNQKAKYTMPSH